MNSANRMRPRALRLSLCAAAILWASAASPTGPAAHADQPTEPGREHIANKPQVAPTTPADTIVKHRPSTVDRWSTSTTEQTILPSKSQAGAKKGWFSDGWYLPGLISLSAVLAMIFAISLLAKKFILPRTRLGHRQLEMVARTYLSGKQSVALVKAGRRLLIVGITPNQITSLGSVDDPAEVAELLGAAAAGRPDSITSQFERNMASESERFGEPDPVEENFEDRRPDFAQPAREQLRRALARVRRLGRRDSGGRNLETQPSVSRPGPAWTAISPGAKE